MEKNMVSNRAFFLWVNYSLCIYHFRAMMGGLTGQASIAIVTCCGLVLLSLQGLEHSSPSCWDGGSLTTPHCASSSRGRKNNHTTHTKLEKLRQFYHLHQFTWWVGSLFSLRFLRWRWSKLTNKKPSVSRRCCPSVTPQATWTMALPASTWYQGISYLVPMAWGKVSF